MKYTFDGKEFQHPDRITNERVITVSDIEGKTEKSAWYLDRDVLPEMMRALLDGPHDDIDWMQQGLIDCVKVYKDFFTDLTRKIGELADTSTTGA